MVYAIFTYGGGEYIVETLNAVVRILGDNNFTTTLRLSFLLGLIGVLTDIAINGNFTKGIKYYLITLISYNILFVPKVNVLITDPLASIRTDRKIDAIPFGLAVFAHSISSLGNWMTKTFEMNFSLPHDLYYSKNGLLFGSSLIRQTLSARMSDHRVNGNLQNFIRQCRQPPKSHKLIPEPIKRV